MERDGLKWSKEKWSQMAKNIDIAKKGYCVSIPKQTALPKMDCSVLLCLEKGVLKKEGNNLQAKSASELSKVALLLIASHVWELLVPLPPPGSGSHGIMDRPRVLEDPAVQALQE